MRPAGSWSGAADLVQPGQAASGDRCGESQHECVDGCSSRWTSGTSTRGVVSLAGHEPAVPGAQGVRRDREDLWPMATVHQSGQGGEPEPIGGLLADRPASCQRRTVFLVPQHEQFGVFAGLAAQQHRRHGRQLPGHLVQQGHGHQSCSQGGNTLALPATITF